MSHPLRCLVLNVDIGAGHRRAAEAFQGAFQRLCPHSEFRFIEALAYLGPGARDVARELYLGIQEDIPDLWGALYEQRDIFSLFAPLSQFVDDLRSQGLRSLMSSFRPHLLLATHPLAAGLAGGLRRQRRSKSPLVVLLTDFDGHPSWITRGADLYLVPSKEVARSLEVQGVVPSRLVACGIPLRQPFEAIRERPASLSALALDQRRLTVLLLGGGLGLGPVLQTAKALSQLQGPLQLVLIAGSNEQLEAQARQLARRSPLPLHVTGLVENMADYMSVADIAVSKPGGLTSAELLAAGVPLIALQPLAGQEEANCAVLQRAGAALRADSPLAAKEALEGLLSNETKRTAMKNAALLLGRPQAALQAARATLALLPTAQ